MRTFTVRAHFSLSSLWRAAIQVGGCCPGCSGPGLPFAGPSALCGGDPRCSRRPPVWQEPGREHLSLSRSSWAGKGLENYLWALSCFFLGPYGTVAISSVMAAVLGNIASLLENVCVWGGGIHSSERKSSCLSIYCSLLAAVFRVS